jgi:Carboxypeptidase regulatory-like domain
MSRKLLVTLLIVSLVWTTFVPAGQAQHLSFRVDGYVKNASLEPVPGLTVSIAHPTQGRTRPRATDSDGYFIFSGLRAMPDPYYLEGVGK